MSFVVSNHYAYDDAVGNRTGLFFQSSILSSIQSSTAYAYDNLDRLTNTASSGLSAAYSLADPAGNLTNKAYNNGVYTDYAYDARGRLIGLTNRTQSAILDAYQYGYDPAQMITSITRLAGAAAPATVGFAYDKTYQLTAEFGRYASNFVPFVSFMVSNQFAYDPAGNRISHSSTLPTFHSSSYLHTSDNQLTGIYWNTDKLNLGGILQDCWTAHWVKVTQSTAATWVPAQLKLRKGQDVAWLATNVPVSGTGTLTFDIQAQITNNYVVTQTVSYTHSSNLPSFQSSIAYGYDANGNRIEKWTNNIFVARYFYGSDNQLLGISFNNDQDCTDSGDYAYDPFGRRISATESGVTRYFVHDGLDCIAEMNSTPSVTKWYVRGSGLGGGIADIIAEVSPTTTNYYCYNHRGDVVGLVSKGGVLTARYEYTAFGLPSTEYRTPNTEYRCIGFSSKEYDSKSGLSYYGFRYYDADSGRWITKDPILWQGGMNLYLIANNKPELFTDLYGLRQCRITTIIGHGDSPKTPTDKIRDPKTDPWYSVSDKFAFLGCYGERSNLLIPQDKQVEGRPVVNHKLYDSGLVLPKYNLTIQAEKMWEAMKKQVKTLCDSTSECCDDVLLTVRAASDDGWPLSGWNP